MTFPRLLIRLNTFQKNIKSLCADLLSESGIFQENIRSQAIGQKEQKHRILLLSSLYISIASDVFSNLLNV